MGSPKSEVETEFSDSFVVDRKKEIFNPFLNDSRINRDFLCYEYSLQPDFYSYWTALQPYSIWVWWLPLGALMVTIAAASCGALAARHARSLSNVIVIFSMYPIVATSSLLTILVPRARLVLEAVGQQAVMAAMYHVVCLLLSECGGTNQLIRAGGRLESRAPPCCCWPCCLLPSPRISRKSLAAVRLIVVQMSLVQALVYIAQLVIAAEDYNLYLRSFAYFQPVVIASILFGVWGATMAVRVSRLASPTPAPRLLSVQLALLIVKLQCGMAKAAPELWKFPCLLAIHPYVFANLIHNCLSIIEMMALSVWAWRLYSNILRNNSCLAKNVSVSAIDDSNQKTLGINAGVENKIFDDKSERL